jgi:hypothetical protein
MTHAHVGCREGCDRELLELSASTCRKKAPSEVDEIGLEMLKAGVEQLSQDVCESLSKAYYKAVAGLGEEAFNAGTAHCRLPPPSCT